LLICCAELRSAGASERGHCSGPGGARRDCRGRGQALSERQHVEPAAAAARGIARAGAERSTAGGRVADPRRRAARSAGSYDMSFDAQKLYELLPAIYRMRDAEEGEPLRSLLTVIADKVGMLEEDLEQFYDDQFIETCNDWVVPYIGDLIGYRSLHGVVP